MKSIDVWVDFNDSNNGNIATLREHAKRPVRVGEQVVVGDGEGDICLATVEAMDNQFIALRLVPNTFTRDGEFSSAVTA